MGIFGDDFAGFYHFFYQRTRNFYIIQHHHCGNFDVLCKGLKRNMNIRERDVIIIECATKIVWALVSIGFLLTILNDVLIRGKDLDRNASTWMITIMTIWMITDYIPAGYQSVGKLIRMFNESKR
jgi:hypothetical protein